MALKDNLIRYYKFEETSGSTVVDATTNSNGTYNGTYTVNQTGKISKSTLYNTGYADLGQLPANFTTNSVSFWFKINGYIGGHVDMIAQFCWQNYYIRLFAHEYLSPTNTLFFDISGTSGGYNAGFAPNTGTWYHIVMITSGNICYIYINGSLAASKSAATYSPGAYNKTTLGVGWQTSSVDGAYCNCNVDELAIWDRALTTTEVAELYNSGNGYEIPLSETTNASFLLLMV